MGITRALRIRLATEPREIAGDLVLRRQVETGLGGGRILLCPLLGRLSVGIILLVLLGGARHLWRTVLGKEDVDVVGHIRRLGKLQANVQRTLGRLGRPVQLIDDPLDGLQVLL